MSRIFLKLACLFAILTTVACTRADPIVGSWRASDATFEFTRDGVFILRPDTPDFLFQSMSGRWSKTEGGTYILVTNPLPLGNTATFTAALAGDQLDLDMMGSKIRLVRGKRGPTASVPTTVPVPQGESINTSPTDPQPSGDGIALNAAAKFVLDFGHRGWTPATEQAEQCDASRRSWIYQGDFDGNGKIDYLVRIKDRERGLVIALLERDTRYVDINLINMNYSDFLDRRFYVVKKGESYENSIDNTRQVAGLDLIAGEVCESSGWIMTYKNGAFVETATGD